MMKWIFALVALAGCAPQTTPVSDTGATVINNSAGAPANPPLGMAGVCDATKVQDVVGKARSDALAEDARLRSGAEIVRYLTPDMMVTQEYRGDRLNLHVGADGKIGSARCG